MDALYATPKEVDERVARVTRQYARKKSKKKKAAE
jgi:hypothetical protein